MVRRIIPCVVALGVMLSAGMAGAGPAPEPEHRGVIASGGGLSETPSGHALFATVGQPVVGTSRTTTGYYLIHGFHSFQHPPVTAVRHWQLY